MTSPIPPVPESGAPASAALSPKTKIFLAGSIIALGLAVAGFHWRRPIENFVNKVVDPVLTAAPLPSGEQIETAPIPAQKIEAPPTPAPDTGAEKYSQAYPPPILVADESPSRPRGKKTVEANKTAEKPTVASSSEFKPVHPLSKPVPSLIKADRSKFAPIPEAKSTSGALDELLPLFDFAENLKPLSHGNAAPVQPSNPFQAVGDNRPALQPLRSRLVPLTPGSAAQGTAAKSSSAEPGY